MIQMKTTSILAPGAQYTAAEIGIVIARKF